MGISKVILWAIKVVAPQVPDLNTAVAATTIDHFTFVTILSSRYCYLRAARPFSLHERLMSKLLLDTDLFTVHIPLTNCAILAAG